MSLALIDTAENAAETSLQQFATFVVDGLLFGVEVLRVQEIIRQQPMTRVPCASPVIEGLINLRGQIVTAIDMRKRLGFVPRAASDESMNVVVRTADGPISLVADQIGDVIEVRLDMFEPLPPTIQPAVRDVAVGVYKLPDRLLLVADIDRLGALDPINE